MSRRKGNPVPKRLINGQFSQLCWNIRSSFHTNRALPDMELLTQNCHRLSPDEPDDIQMLSIGDFGTESQNLCSSDDDTMDDTYKLTICDEIYSNHSARSAGLLGCLSGMPDFFLSSKGKSVIQEANILLKVNKAVGQDNGHDVPSEAGPSKARYVCDSDRFVNVFATYEQIDSLQFLCNKAIVEVVIDADDLLNQPECKLMVYLNEKGFTKIDVPSEDPSMGKVYKSMKILMQWLRGPLLPEINPKPTMHYDDQIESVFNALKSKQISTGNVSSSKERNTYLGNLQHPSLVPLLRGYQKRAVHWMIEQETVDPAPEEKVPHPLWKSISIGDKQACYNPHTGRICRDQIYHQGYPSGGILADEMGLGKTVEVLACILNNPRQSETEMESHEDMLQTELNNCPSDSPCSSNSVFDEKVALAIKPAALESLKGNEENLITKATKHTLPLDSDVKEHRKKAKIESCDVPSRQLQVDKSSPVATNVCHDKSPLSSGPITSNVTVCREMMEWNDFPTESPKASIDDVAAKGIENAKSVDVQSENMKPTGTLTPTETFKKDKPPNACKDNVAAESVENAKFVDVQSESMKPTGTLAPTETFKKDKPPNSCKDNVAAESVENAKFVDVQSESMKPFVTIEKVKPPSEDNEIPKSIGEVKSIEAQPDSKLPTTVVEKDKIVRCICGKDRADAKDEVFTCTSCSFSQHPKCIGLKKNTDENYVCPDCSVKMPLIESNSTLIVSPVTIAHQWLDEIHRHILPGSLNVMVYEGVAKQGFVYPSVLADNDVIVTTYEVLKRDFHHLPSKKDNHNYRRPKRYATWPCPLTCIKFWRICLDEAQMVENTTAKTTETALNLSAVHRWCITGTPIQKTIDDLYGLFLFLGVEPYYRKTWWKKLLYEPFLRGDPKPLKDALYNVMWRTPKKDVIDEINLPEQKELMNCLNFSPVEYHFYCRQYEECSRSALKELNKFQEAETELNSLGSYSAHKVLWPLLRLRQACCHPQAVRGGYLALQKSMITMHQLLESLINKAKNESQDAHRLLLCALNGLAGTYILQEGWQHAVDVYRDAIASWKEHEELFKTDSLQKLHTLHNLNEVLQNFKSNTRTLRDDFLKEEAFEIRDKYLQKWRDQVKSAENETNDARQAHEEAKKKVDFKCPWWMTYLQDIVDNGRNQGDKTASERLVDRVKSDLTAVRNVQEFDSVSIADSFSDLRGLQLLLFQRFEEMEDCHENLFKELKSLMVEPTKEMVVLTAECCLRPTVDSTAESCCFCRVNDTLSVYESLIFGHQGIKNNDAESIGGLRAETEAVRALKSINAFLKSESKRHYKYYVELQQHAQCHFEYLDLIKKNFKVYRQLWHALRGRVSALDELDMCTMRLRLRFPGEIVPENQTHIIDPTQVEITQMGFRSDKTIANSRLRKSLGQLLYLKNLAKTQSTDSGENSELCPICTKILGYQWSVFSCGHCLCCECIWVLLERPDFPGRASSYVRCPMCRENTMVQDISYVSTIRQLTEEDKDLVVKGSHSTKIEAAVRTLMRIQRTDPQAKTLVFSTWQDVLDVISRALAENNMKFRSIKKSKNFESNLEEFKKSDDISILLLPIQSGSNGLNIIEATHVILVEPSLNPSLERQAVGRIHRIGQTKPTFIHRLLIANTVEEKIMRFLQNKAECGLRCGTRRTDGENIPLTVGELTSFFQSAET